MAISVMQSSTASFRFGPGGNRPKVARHRTPADRLLVGLSVAYVLVALGCLTSQIAHPPSDEVLVASTQM